MEDVASGGFETKGIGLWIEAFGPERTVAWPAFVEAIQVRACRGVVRACDARGEMTTGVVDTRRSSRAWG